MFWTYVALGVGILILFVGYLQHRLRMSRPSVEQAPPASAPQPIPLQSNNAAWSLPPQAQGQALPIEVGHLCVVCGLPATQVMPKIERGRGAWSWFRELFALPPQYKRTVPAFRPPTLCDSHAHVADAHVEEFIHVRVRGKLTEAYREIAKEAAVFEQETLAKLLTESLTD